ncbi:hypothetical protein [Vibrio stylophorae]|uniref:hypothetical protein n=1 Tax=Vibrio stylophorae TaxID=659351 RepID=UPI001F19CA6B|nr:hypothetical protein [Vibrio stylophorae]
MPTTPSLAAGTALPKDNAVSGICVLEAHALVSVEREKTQKRQIEELDRVEGRAKLPFIAKLLFPSTVLFFLSQHLQDERI